MQLRAHCCCSFLPGPLLMLLYLHQNAGVQPPPAAQPCDKACCKHRRPESAEKKAAMPSCYKGACCGGNRSWGGGKPTDDAKTNCPNHEGPLLLCNGCYKKLGPPWCLPHQWKLTTAERASLKASGMSAAEIFDVDETMVLSSMYLDGKLQAE